MIRTDLTSLDFHTINVHLDTNTNEWRADWHTMQSLIQITGTDTFPNIPWIIKDFSQRVAEQGYVLASFQCGCATCLPLASNPVQRFIERMYATRNNAVIPQAKETYEKMIDVAQKHQVSYGEENVQELIEYFDNLAPQLAQYPARLVKQQASDLHRRTENRSNREAAEAANLEAERQALAAQHQGSAAD